MSVWRRGPLRATGLRAHSRVPDLQNDLARARDSVFQKNVVSGFSRTHGGVAALRWSG